MVAGPWWHSWSLRTSVSLFNPRSIIPLKGASREFPGGPVIEILPSNAGSSGSVPGRGTEIPCAAEQLSPHAPATEPTCPGTRVPQLRTDAARDK